MTFSLKIKPIKEGYVIHEVELYHGDELLAQFILFPEDAQQLRRLIHPSERPNMDARAVDWGSFGSGSHPLLSDDHHND